MVALSQKGQSVGRPRDARIDLALREAGGQLLRDHGYEGLSIEALCRTAGCTRRTFFLRYDTVDDLVLDVLKQKFGDNKIAPGPNLHDSLTRMQESELAMFRDPLMHGSIPGVFEAMRVNSTLRKRYVDDFVTPRRQSVAALINVAKTEQQITSESVDLDAICDLLIGPLLARLLVSGPAALSDDLVELTVRAALAQLGFKPRQGAGSRWPDHSGA